MTKPSVTTQAVKAAPLTYEELDTNFTNLRDSTVSLTAGASGTPVTADLNGNITLIAGTGITLAGNNTTKEITINSSGGGGNAFGTIAVSGQVSVLADQINDTLTLIGGTGITITTNAINDSITFTATGDSTPRIPVVGTHATNRQVIYAQDNPQGGRDIWIRDDNDTQFPTSFFRLHGGGSGTSNTVRQTQLTSSAEILMQCNRNNSSTPNSYTFIGPIATVAEFNLGAVILPRITTVQRNALYTTQPGSIIFNTTTENFEGYNGTSWVTIG